MDVPNTRETEIFETAMKTAAGARAAYLDETCGKDSELRKRILEAIGRATENPSAPPPSPVSQETIRLSPSASALGEKAGDHIGRYKLLEIIGEGGMGRVWAAEQTEPLRRRVALKVVKLGMDTRQVIARFEAERQALAVMDHPGIAKVFDAGATAAGRPYFVMELVQGIPITEYCDKHNLPARDRLDLFVHVCRAIYHAHEKGIIHRDIKPSNVLITLNDGRPLPKIIDFGIAKAIAGQRLTDKTLHTVLSEFIGTPMYMSPEQAEMSAVSIDIRSDIYSLGVLLYELMTGTTPFDSHQLLKAGVDGIRKIIREQDPPRPSTRLSLLDATTQTAIARHRQTQPPELIRIVRGDLDWIILKTLEKDRTKRYDTAQSLASDVSHYLENKPIIARPPSEFDRIQKFLRRHRSAVAASCVIFILAMSLLLSFLHGAGARGSGEIDIESDPSGAAVRFDGEKLGTTPYTRKGIAPGQHTCLLEFPGYDACRTTIQIAPGKQFQFVAYLKETSTGVPTNVQASVKFPTDDNNVVAAVTPGSATRVLSLQGRVELLPSGAVKWVMASPSQVLHPGDRLRTGPDSSVSVQFEAGPVTRLSELTEIEILPTTGPNDVPRVFRKGDPSNSIKLRTPHATATIRG